MYLSYLIFILGDFMKLKKLFLSLKEIFIIFGIEYFILIISFIIWESDKSGFIGGIILIFFDICYIGWKIRKIDVSFNIRNNYFLYVLLGISLAVIYNMILYKLNLYSGDGGGGFLIIFASGLIGPIFEELLFRVGLINGLEEVFDNKLGIVLLSSLVFAIFHTNIYSLVIAFVLGIVNGFIYVKERDVVKVCLVHCALNVTSFILTGYNFLIFMLGICLFVISLIGFRKKLF